MHPGMKRAWLQTGGQPVQPLHTIMRAELDAVDHVNWLGAGCFKLFDAAGVQVGILQYQSTAQARVDDAAVAEIERAAQGLERQPDVAAGDTVIRALDPRDPADMALAANALSGADPSISIPDIERSDPPPLDLPDYEGPRTWRPQTVEGSFRSGLAWAVAVALAAIVIGLVVLWLAGAF